jgi:diguanylate cyclase (GGDEF)-like protein
MKRFEEFLKMRVPLALNYIFCSFLVMVLIFADYRRKFNTDAFQRDIFLQVIEFNFIAMAGDFFYYLIEGSPGTGRQNLLYIILTLYYVFQIAGFFYIFIFVDYLTFKSMERTRRIKRIVLSIMAFHVLILLINLREHFYFYFSAGDNILVYGDKYFIRLIFSCSPAVIALVDIFLFKENIKRQFPLFFIFITIFGGGSVLDIFLGRNGALIWPCYAAALLYAYFFIIRSDSNIDSLTGIGNRYAFNEFIDKLSRQNSKESWSVVMIDLDRFKQINDTLGHLEGDNALRDMAAIIKGCIRHSDFAARYGGDEFIIAASAEYDIKKLMARIQLAIDVQNEKHSRPYQIEMSYGYDVYTTGQNQSITDFMTRIDQLMYQHKEARRRIVRPAGTPV